MRDGKGGGDILDVPDEAHAVGNTLFGGAPAQVVRVTLATLRVARQEFGPLVGPSDALLYRDVHDHLARFADQLENARESAISILDVYLALTNNRLNETMKFLTLFTAILMPLTVISGIYGMNFEFMPELQWKYGYFLSIGLMVGLDGLLFWKLRKEKWL